MSNNVIEVENLSKQYRLGKIGTGALGHDINRWWHTMRGKEDPYLKIGEVNDRTKAGSSDYVWSLRDINFNIEQGDSVGIIGRNGAGKSTLLKILSRVTAPTTGLVKIKGRVASLLEVGTGFHPDLSGRENIYLNGAILGMRKQEVKRKFDEIVDFAGVERYIDTPVKRYSSGMYVRLAFGVAAHLESEILIVDEVLAVGDAEFQKKCLGKMNDVSKGEGRTVLFVSHNMGSISQLCTKGIMLKYGQLHSLGKVHDIVNDYIADGNVNVGNENEITFPADYSKRIGHLLSYKLTNNDNKVKSVFANTSDITLNLKFLVNEFTSGLQVGVGLQNKNMNRVTTFVKPLEKFSSGEVELKLVIPGNIIAPGLYSFVIALWDKSKAIYDLHEQIGKVHIVDTGSELSLYEGEDYGSVIINGRWE
jgi:lipopolysaccharide transport system ATP-binding protein